MIHISKSILREYLKRDYKYKYPQFSLGYGNGNSSCANHLEIVIGVTVAL